MNAYTTLDTLSFFTLLCCCSCILIIGLFVAIFYTLGNNSFQKFLAANLLNNNSVKSDKTKSKTSKPSTSKTKEDKKEENFIDVEFRDKNN